MKKIITCLFTAVTTVSLMACVQVDTVANNTQLATSSVRDLPITYPQGSVFALDPKHLKHVSIKAEQQKAVYKLYENAIISDLNNHGYHLAADQRQAKFHVGFLVALEEDLSDKKISEKFGVMPGLPTKGDQEKGSLLIYVEDVATGQRVWRSTVQGFVRTDLSNSERDVRSKQVIETALAQFYQH